MYGTLPSPLDARPAFKLRDEGLSRAIHDARRSSPSAPETHSKAGELVKAIVYVRALSARAALTQRTGRRGRHSHLVRHDDGRFGRELVPARRAGAGRVQPGRRRRVDGHRRLYLDALVPRPRARGAAARRMGEEGFTGAAC